MMDLRNSKKYEEFEKKSDEEKIDALVKEGCPPSEHHCRSLCPMYCTCTIVLAENNMRITDDGALSLIIARWKLRKTN